MKHSLDIRPASTLAVFLFANLCLFFAARLALLYFLWPLVSGSSPLTLAEALYVGLKFDARYAVFLSIPLALCLFIPPLERVMVKGRGRPALLGLEGLLFAFMLFVTMLDFGYFFYLQQRLDNTFLDLAKDTLISATMLWESYPVIRLVLAFGLAVALWTWGLKKLLAAHRIAVLGKKRRAVLTLLTFVVLFLMGYGQISSNLFPLRWSNAYFSPDPHIATLALHPIQNLYDTRKAHLVSQPDAAAVRDAYPRMAAWLNLPATEPGPQPDYGRFFPGKPDAPRLNVVVILMESLALPRTSLAPGQDDPTPFLRELADKGLYFPNFYAPTRTTARGIFTSITGIPDVNFNGGTSSRNPAVVEQNTVFNQFEGYEKYYMIGGSASWANIRGVLQRNIAGLKLMEEGAWQAPNVDVWGVSDVALLREAVGVFNESPKPFAAFIQAASFHRPYTIPDDNEGFKPAPEPSRETLANYGFESAEEYQSLRLADHALRVFFEKASHEPWFKNTVFAITGDHGLTNPSGNMSPGYLACGLQAWHVPLILYAPGGQVTPGVDEAPAVQPDIFPTLAGLAGIPYNNTTLGRDLLDPAQRHDPVAYIFSNEDFRFLIKDNLCYSHMAQEALYDLGADTLNDISAAMPEVLSDMRRMSYDLQQTARYMLFNNKMPRKKLPADTTP